MDLSRYTFTDRLRNYSASLTHTSELFYDGIKIATGKATWCNRSWEPYPYFTSRKNAIKQAMDKGKVTGERMNELISLLNQYTD